MNLKEINKKNPKLPNFDLLRINRVFEEKRWKLTGLGNDDVYNNFCSMLASLNQEQRDLMLSLTEKFLWVKELEYANYFIEAFSAFVATNPDCKKIYLCPIIGEKDFGKNKSGNFLLYILKSYLLILNNRFNELSFNFFDSPINVPVNSKKKDFTICLIDDFIGTGQSAIAATEYFLNKSISKEQMAIISLVGMESGIFNLENNKFRVYTCKRCEKGIGNNKDKIKIMKDIENTIGVEEQFQFGFCKSEGLVRMVRTPNNTFPIYWLRNKKYKYAPFPR